MARLRNHSPYDHDGIQRQQTGYVQVQGDHARFGAESIEVGRFHHFTEIPGIGSAVPAGARQPRSMAQAAANLWWNPGMPASSM